ncbi:MAG: hypothetical protein K6D97_07310 [Clostridia bacterium]|nr:hypothetical protein [Clostridia bacterium]
MDNEYSILKILNDLKRHNILSTKEVKKDLQKLIGSDIYDFARVFLRDFLRMEFDNYNKFEILRNLNREQRKRLKGTLLRRYEYRNSSNLRILFVVYNDNLSNIPIILCAFNEDGDKKKGNNSYNKNIDRAIRIFERVVGGKNDGN